MVTINIISGSEIEKEANKFISKYGYACDHNFRHFQNFSEEGEEPFVVKIEINGEEYGILAHYNKRTKEWVIFSGILAPQNIQMDIVIHFLNYAFENGAYKVWIEVKPDERRHLLKLMKKDGKFRSSKIRYSLESPVFDLRTWDGDKMEGQGWKDIRYYWNRYFRDHKVEFKEAKDVDKNQMKELVKEWKESRTPGDKAVTERYDQAIDDGFNGYDLTRIMIVDGKVSAITAGFKIPNSKNYYSSIGIYSRKIDRTGEIANMDDLRNLKKFGFELIDFGNGEKELTAYKKKFHPDHTYKTFIFSIVKKKI